MGARLARAIRDLAPIKAFEALAVSGYLAEGVLWLAYLLVAAAIIVVMVEF